MTEKTLSRMLDTVWSQLARGAKDRRHPARHPTLATIGPNGPEARTLVLRGVERASAELEFHTDAASPKAEHIAANPLVAIHVWIPKSDLQIRMTAMARFERGSADVFARLPPEAQANYTGAVPGTPLGQGGQDTATGIRFARLLCNLTSIDALVLETPHRRARFEAATDWQGIPIAP